MHIAWEYPPLVYGGLGRHVHALATAGALGVAHCIRLLRDEFEACMALSGCATLADIQPDLLDQA